MEFMELAGSVALYGPAVIGLVQVAKHIGLPNKYSSALAVLLGIGLAYMVEIPQVEPALQGVLVGLSAVGLYSGYQYVKNIDPNGR